MTVGELITILQTLPQGFKVSVEGCDCIGPAVTAYIYRGRSEEDFRTEEPRVLIARTERGSPDSAV